MRRIIKKLAKLGWKAYLSDHMYFKYEGSNRYVDIDLPYIDIYTYTEEGMYKGYLTIKEFKLFYKLSKKLNKV